jgi:hypothetical protein
VDDARTWDEGGSWDHTRTWDAARPEGVGAAGDARSVDDAPPVELAAERRRRRRIPAGIPAGIAAAALIALGVGLQTLAAPKTELAVAGFTNAPSASLPAVAAASPTPAPLPSPRPSTFESIPPTTAPSSSVIEPTTAPGPAEPNEPNEPNATSGPATTPRATPKPTPKPTKPPPTPAPTDQPTVAPTQAICTVPILIGTHSATAKGKWANAGFTGGVDFEPDVPPPFTIESQSLAPGTTADCSSGITVTGTP